MRFSLLSNKKVTRSYAVYSSVQFLGRILVTKMDAV